MRTFFLSLLLTLALAGAALAQAGRIYTKPDPANPGALTGRVSKELTHAVAIEYDRTRVYLAELTGGGRQFRFANLPIGKYDLVLFSKNGSVFEGLALGASTQLPAAEAAHLKERIAAQDGFFNQATLHRFGLSEDGETLLAFVERYRANDVLKQSGEALKELVRRFEVIEFARASDDWQLTTTRHIYREGEPIPAAPQFRKTLQLPALGGLRVITNLKDLGEIALPE
jgi:hypothetical protein